MMKKLFCCLPILALVFSMISCTKYLDETEMVEDSKQHELSLVADAGVFQQDVATKASTDAVIRALWEENDKVSVINVTKGKLLGGHLIAEESGSSVIFSGTVTGTMVNGDKLAYVYPAIKDNSAEEVFTESLQNLTSQTYNPDTKQVAFYGYAEDVFSSSTMSKRIIFSLATSYVHLNMSGLTVSTPVSTVSVNNINGGFKWVVENGNFKIEPCMAGSSINVACTDVTTTSVSGNAIIHFAVPVSSAVDERALSVNNTLTAQYTAAERKSATYYNQLYTKWQNKVTVTDGQDVTTVEINDPSTESVSASLGKDEVFKSDKATNIEVGGLGTIIFDDAATNKIRSNAESESATNVFFKVENITEKVQHVEQEIVYEVTMKTVDESGAEVFSETKADGTATVIVPLPNAQSVENVSLITGSGKVPIQNFTFANGVLTFTVSHFSQYSIEYTLCSDLVAETGNRQYPTLASAIEAANPGYTVKLLKNISVESPLTIDKNLILNLENHTITCATPYCDDPFSPGRPFLVASNTEFTICNGVFVDGLNGLGLGVVDTRLNGTTDQTNVTLKVENVDIGVFNSSGDCTTPFNTDNGAIFRFRGFGNCILNNVRVSSDHYIVDDTATNGEVTVNVSGGKYLVNHSADCQAYDCGSGKIVIAFCLNGLKNYLEDVEIVCQGCSSCVELSDGTIKNCTFSAVGNPAILCYDYNEGNNKVVIDGGTYASSGDTGEKRNAVHIQTSGGTVDIIDGTFIGAKNALFANVNQSQYSGAASIFNVYGGKIKGDMTISSSPCYIKLYGGVYSVQPSTTDATIQVGYVEGNNSDPDYPWKLVKVDAEIGITKAGVETRYITLKEFRDETNSVNGNTFAGYTVTLLKDVDLNNEEWTPISNYAYGKGSDKLFAGTFDGGNHTISNLKIAANTVDALGNNENLANGFFGQVATCTIKNLKFANANVTSSGLNAVVASLHTVSTGKLVMDNVHVLSGSVVNTDNAGGLMAFVTGWSEYTDCVNYASVSGYGVGGIVGMLRDNTATNTCTISNCTNYGTITNTIGGGDGAGGITSKINNSGTINGCKNYGTVTGTVGNVYAGGIIGVANPNSKTFVISDCINYANISSNAGEFGRAGGILGSFGGSLTIERCVNTGAITGYQGAGGINGWNGDSWGLVVKYSYNSGSIVSSNGHAGGIEQGNINQTASYSLNNSSVTAGEGKTAWQISNSSSTITSCYYYEGATLKTNAGTTVDDIDAAVTDLNTSLSTPFWGKDGNNEIKPLVLIQ